MSFMLIIITSKFCDFPRSPSLEINYNYGNDNNPFEHN